MHVQIKACAFRETLIFLLCNFTSSVVSASTSFATLLRRQSLTFNHFNHLICVLKFTYCCRNKKKKRNKKIKKEENLFEHPRAYVHSTRVYIRRNCILGVLESARTSGSTCQPLVARVDFTRINWLGDSVGLIVVIYAPHDSHEFHGARPLQENTFAISSL